jgi:hypothetical protein
MGGTPLLLALVLAAGPAEEPDCTVVDERGRSFPVCFDPGNGLLLGVSLVQRDGVAFAPAASFSTGLLLRTRRTSRRREDALWFYEHRLLGATAQPAAEHRALRVTAYEGNFRRHLREGFVLIPTAQPIRLPFPFDFAINVSAGRYERRVWEGPGATLEVARAAVLLDPIRSETGRARLSFGPALSYTLRLDGVELVQEISPLTSGLVDLGYESEDGWWSLRLAGYGGWVFMPGRGEGRFRARGEATAQRILVALNDQPVHLDVSVAGVLADAGVQRRTEWIVSVGLVMRAFGP